MRITARCLGPAVIIAIAVAAAAAEPSPREIRRQIDSVDGLLAVGKADEAAAALAAGLEGLTALQAGERPPAGLKFLLDRATRARKSLEAAGVDVSRLEVPRQVVAAGGAPAAAAAAPRRTEGVSFARQVAPFLVANCGRCHVAGRKGGFQMASHEQLMRSAKVSPGMGRRSELVEVILSGEMPPGGARIAPDDVGMLVAWIDSGAACDVDPGADLAAVARAGSAPPPAAEPPRPPPAALRPGDVSFAGDVAPVLLAQCTNCHGDRSPESNLRLTTLESILKGGRSGPAVVPGRGGDSLLVRKLRGAGIEGQRMPLGKDPLPDEQIAMIAKWIDQGARIDLLTPQDTLDTVAAAARSRRLPDEELSRIRFAAGEKLWGRVIPDERPTVLARGGVCLIGNLPPERMERLAAEADDVAGAVGREFGDDGPLVKGGVVLFAFRKAYDYSELWQVVFDAERPRGMDGHAGVAGDVAYGAFVVPSDDESGGDTRLLLAEQTAAAALAARGLPDWFCRGAGRAVAVRVVPRAPLAQQWKKDVSAAIKALGSADDFLAGRADPTATALAAGGFVQSLAGGGRLAQFVSLVDGGLPFDEAFTKSFRSPPQQAFTTWATRNAGR